MGLILKPKGASPFLQLKDTKGILDEAVATGRCLLLEEDSEFHREYWRKNNLFTVLPALAADVTVSVSLTTPGRESALAGTRAIYYNHLLLRDHPICRSDAAGNLAFSDVSSLIQAIRDYRSGKRPGLGDHSSLLDEIDPFRDGRAGERIGTYIRWFLEELNAGRSRDEALSLVNERYSTLWGVDKTIRGAGTAPDKVTTNV